MKHLKNALLLIAAGQLISSYYKDKDFKEKLVSRETFNDKLKVIWDQLVDVNSQFFADIKGYNYRDKADEVKTWAFDQYKVVEDEVKKLKEMGINVLNNQKVRDSVDMLRDKIVHIKSTVETAKDEIFNKYELEDKFHAIKTRLDSITKN